MAAKIEQHQNEMQGEKCVVACNKCSGETNHVVLLSVDISGREDSVDFQWIESYQIIQCQGCNAISFRNTSSNSEDYDFDEGGIQNSTYEILYPSRLKGRTGIGSEARYLPPTVHKIYQETLNALNNNLPILTGVGLRALVETVCQEKAAGDGSLLKKINNLVTKQVLTPASASILHKIRTLGNKAAHEVTPHSDKLLSLAMDVVEHLLRDVYILPKLTKAEFDDD